MFETELAYWLPKFRSLSGWTITIVSDDVCLNGSHINADTRTATIFEWGDDKAQPSDYILHELLHIAFAEAAKAPRSNHNGCPLTDCKCEDEERFIQDLCKLLPHFDLDLEV